MSDVNTLTLEDKFDPINLQKNFEVEIIGSCPAIQEKEYTIINIKYNLYGEQIGDGQLSIPNKITMNGEMKWKQFYPMNNMHANPKDAPCSRKGIGTLAHIETIKKVLLEEKLIHGFCKPGHSGRTSAARNSHLNTLWDYTEPKNILEDLKYSIKYAELVGFDYTDLKKQITELEKTYSIYK